MTDAHSRPTGSTADRLYDVDVPTPSHAERARTLVARESTATLCTVLARAEGVSVRIIRHGRVRRGRTGLSPEYARRAHQESLTGPARIGAACRGWG